MSRIRVSSLGLATVAGALLALAFPGTGGPASETITCRARISPMHRTTLTRQPQGRI